MAQQSLRQHLTRVCPLPGVLLPLHVWPADRLIRYAEQHLGDRLPATIQAARRVT
ncbi:MAG: hypothetical protein M3Z04_17880 [Chloroflexota bacterium]|nr:hypothetical protein [Chloroflexota bacterium]